MELKKVILSRGRASAISTHKFIRDAVIVCPDTEVDGYRKCGLEIVPIPESVRGLGAVRNWCLDHFTEDLVMIDDDLKKVFFLGGPKLVYFTDPEDCSAIINNCYVMAGDADCRMFGFNQTYDIRKFDPHDPFLLNSWTGGIIGVIGRDPELRFIETNKGKVDIDFCLQNLMKYRRVWIDDRYAFQTAKDNNRGGSSEFRTLESLNAEMMFLKRKWGKYIAFGKCSSRETVRLHVDRRVRISF